MIQSSLCFLLVVRTCFALQVVDEPLRAFRDGAGNVAEDAAEDVTGDVVVPDASEAMADSSIRDMMDKSGISMDEEQAAGVAVMLSSIRLNKIEEFTSPAAVFGFLMSNKGNVRKALQQHNKAAEWRRNYPGSIRSLMKEFSPSDYYIDDEVRSSEGCADMYRKEPSSTEGKIARKYLCMSRLKQTNKAGEAINVVSIAAFTKNGGLDHLAFVERASIAYYEDNYQCLMSTSQGKDKLVLGHSIMDLRDTGFSDITRVPKAKVFMNIVQKYPQLMKTVSLINAPKLFATVYKLIVPMIPPADRALIRISSGGFNKEMQEFSNIDIATLPKRFGGEASDDELCAIGEHLPADDLPTVARNRASRNEQEELMTWDVTAEDDHIVQLILEETDERKV